MLLENRVLLFFFFSSFLAIIFKSLNMRTEEAG